MSQSSSLVLPVEEKPKAKIIEENAAAGSTSERLVADLTGLVKSLRSIKAVQLRYVEASLGKEQDTEPVAFIDGGATHPLRCGAPEELEDAEAVSVELAFGSATLYKKRAVRPCSPKNRLSRSCQCGCSSTMATRCLGRHRAVSSLILQEGRL